MGIGRSRALIVGVVVAVAGVARAESTYLALGDSLGWGYSRFALDIQPNGGDQGYVSLYADYLATQHAGVRPNLVNLSIPQETSSSFFTGGQLGTLLNSHYPLVSPPTQHQLMLDTIADQHAMGNTIDHVTVQLGVNDFLDLATPDFLTLPSDQQFGQILVVFDRMIDNLTIVLDDLGTLAPEADVRVMGYYNPYGLFLDHPELDPSADGTGVAIAQIADPISMLLNDVLGALAADRGVAFVPVFDRFDGREAELTRITTLDLGNPNIHPTDAGYAEMAAALIAVPAPGEGGLLVLAGVLAARRRR
ncbi:MAG: SGNH/GDSL hydrolase family protein [Phycisphaerales bacterium]